MTNDKQRERLVELIGCACREYAEYSSEMFAEGDYGIESMEEYITDYILKRGVLCPPCKVGDTVYVLEDWGYEKELEEKEVGVIAIAGTDDFSKELWEDFHGCAIGTFADVGKTVFLTREEAEQALVTDKNVGGKKEEGASDSD